MHLAPYQRPAPIEFFNGLLGDPFRSTLFDPPAPTGQGSPENGLHTMMPWQACPPVRSSDSILLQRVLSAAGREVADQTLIESRRKSLGASMMFTTAGLADAKARSSAGASSSLCSTYSPWHPRGITTCS